MVQADADRAYRMHLAAIREAGHQTQAEIARRLGKPRGNIARTEHSTDMLYSTLLSYLEAAGASDVAPASVRCIDLSCSVVSYCLKSSVPAELMTVSKS